jgi:hypothetical protein
MGVEVIPRSETLLPVHPPSYYQGPYNKRGICWHNMGAHESYPVTEGRALQIQKVNHDYQIHRWSAIDIIEGYDLILVNNTAWALEGRPSWSNCDAFSGAAKIGYPYIGVEVSGNYDVNHPRDDMLQAMAELAATLYLGGKCGLDFRLGHRDFNYLSTQGPTTCPGANLYPRLAEVQAEAERIINGGTKEGEVAIYHPKEVSRQGDKFVYVFDDAMVGNGWSSYFNLYNEDYTDGIKVEVYTSEKKPPVKKTVSWQERYSLDLKACVGIDFKGGFAVIVKVDKPDPGTVTVFRG